MLVHSGKRRCVLIIAAPTILNLIFTFEISHCIQIYKFSFIQTNHRRPCNLEDDIVFAFC